MRWAILAVIGAILVVNGQAAKPHPNTDKRHSTAESKDAPDTPAGSVVIVNQQTSQWQGHDHPGKPPSYLDELLMPANLPSLLLVGVGIAGIVAAFLTLRTINKQVAEMRRQVDLTFGQLRAMHEQITEMSVQTDVLERSVAVAKESADAAGISANAMINSERAWIMTEAVFSADFPGLPSPTTLRIIEGTTNGVAIVSVDVCLICKNDGRTPAWITETQIHLRNVAVLPIQPDYVVEGLDFRSKILQPLKVGEDFKMRWTPECDGPTEAGKTLVLYGYVKYRDAFGPDRETRFAYTVQGRTLRRFASTDDYWEYNKYT